MPDPYQPPKHAEPPTTPPRYPSGSATGCDTWLMFPILGLLYAILCGVQTMWEIVNPSVYTGFIKLTTTPFFQEGHFYDQFTHPMAWVEAITVIALAIFSLALLVMIVREKKALPKLMILYYVLWLIIAGVDLIQEKYYKYSFG